MRFVRCNEIYNKKSSNFARCFFYSFEHCGFRCDWLVEVAQYRLSPTGADKADSIAPLAEIVQLTLSSAPTQLFLGFISYCRHFNPTYSLSYDYLIAKKIRNTKTWHSTMLLDRGLEILDFESQALIARKKRAPISATDYSLS